MTRYPMVKGQFPEITVMTDNQSQDKSFLMEHGLSIYLRVGGVSALFDTGQSDMFLLNSKSLGISISSIRAFILSHGHYDHSGGLQYLDGLVQDVPHYLHRDAVKPRYRRMEDGSGKPIGMPKASIEYLHRNHNILRYMEKPVEVLPDVWATGPIPRSCSFENTGGPFYDDSECFEQDSIQDDQALWIRTSSGPIVLLGCAHSGTVNTLNYIAELCHTDRIRAVIGGMHLNSASTERLYETASALQAFSPEIVAPCHCTGDGAMEFMSKALPDTFLPCGVGSRFVFPE